MIIAQLTDTHIRAEGRLAYGRVDTAAHLARAVAHLNNLSPRPDVTLVSGDICDFGRAEEYALARRLLDGLAMPYFVIPGNHDHPGELRRAFADHAYLPDDGFVHYAIDDYPVRMIGLDSTVTGEPGGRICVARRDWLAARLAEAPDKTTLVFMHHPPFETGIRHMDVQNCAEGAALGQLLEAHRQVTMLLCGHIHRAIAAPWHGIIACIAPSPAHAVSLDLDPDGAPGYEMEPPACRLVFLTADGRLVAHLSPVGDFDGPHPFREPGGAFIE